MTEEELNRLEAVVRKRAALGDIDSEPSLSLIALDAAGFQVVPKDPTLEMAAWREDAALPPSGSGEV